MFALYQSGGVLLGVGETAAAALDEALLEEADQRLEMETPQPAARRRRGGAIVGQGKLMKAEGACE